MKNMFLVIILFMLIFVFVIIDKHDARVYDCGMAEWHPDIPKEVKDECRRMRRDEWQRQQDGQKKLIST